MKQGGAGEKILRILLGIFGIGLLLVCAFGGLFSIHGLGKLEWFWVGIGIASAFWYIYHLKYADPSRYEAIMKELKGKRNTQNRE